MTVGEEELGDKSQEKAGRSHPGRHDPHACNIGSIVKSVQTVKGMKTQGNLPNGSPQPVSAALRP